MDLLWFSSVSSSSQDEVADEEADGVASICYSLYL